MSICLNCKKEIKDGAQFCPHCGAAQSVSLQPHQLPPGTVLNRKYRVDAVLGEGGFGITYAGMDTALNLKVAVKEFYPSGFVSRVATVSANVSALTDPGKIAFYEKGKLRFLQEAQTLAKFSRARGIVEVRDFFEENNTAYIVMEYLDGVTLKQYLKEHGKLSPEETLRLLTPVMESLKLLHKENLIHRDISPDNIMLTDDGVKLLDFGAARNVEGDNKSLSVMLKPGYAPEEQYRSKGKQGPWTDVYALCATMYKCITGIRPDESPDRLDEDTLQAPSALGVAIDPQYEAALMKGLAVKARDRWQSIDELLAALSARQPEIKVTLAQPPQDTTRILPQQESRKDTPTQAVQTPQTNMPQYTPAQPQYQPPAQNSPAAAPAPRAKNNRGLKVAIGVVAVLVVVIVIVIIALSGKSIHTNDGNTDNAETTANSENNSTVYGADGDTIGTEVGNTYIFGNYEQDNDTSNGEEAIEWLVLKKEGNKALVISKYALDCQRYNNESTAVTWETCSLRTWLNNDFYNTAFSESEKSRIQSTTVTADANPDYDTDPGNDTTDHVFLLSISEVNEYFSTDEARKCAATEYAKEQGAWASDDYMTSDGKATCCWWLRSPGFYTDFAAEVYFDGRVDSVGNFVYYMNNSVRPALWLDL